MRAALAAPATRPRIHLSSSQLENDLPAQTSYVCARRLEASRQRLGVITRLCSAPGEVCIACRQCGCVPSSCSVCSAFKPQRGMSVPTTLALQNTMSCGCHNAHTPIASIHTPIRDRIFLAASGTNDSHLDSELKTCSNRQYHHLFAFAMDRLRPPALVSLDVPRAYDFLHVNLLLPH